jgi:hypothetical protein
MSDGPHNPIDLDITPEEFYRVVEKDIVERLEEMQAARDAFGDEIGHGVTWTDLIERTEQELEEVREKLDEG